ncbi:MAG: nicotinate-nucleotide adenylyltransferase [Gemmatimonadota bacterium]|nr:nicotinic acid mononucleotide adenylyltransferase [Gemmatimonadota bacterium]MDP6461629.1 nicotinate-nucleotide adenylyltransferase [Gemmatimonadota bacterium]MDP6528093.1 nicotinate-nucleotide adenylyltransferase [Gemmatimonadota bacterium]MDP6802287.1 nicotinate-nucleotide adenylyltransferase [Gemmatimonadota bacterium]MDP7031979.1 nicotinate-nucleotide adenylyltransferase [Gemmatimonadota bacterium]
MARLGIFGGTFDPIHTGHLIIAAAAADRLRLDQVLFVPARVPPHKGPVGTSAEHRYRMVVLAIDGNPGFSASNAELGRDGPSYTVETLRDFRRDSPSGTELFLIMGTDSILEIESWKDYDTLLEESEVVVLARQGSGTEGLPAAIRDRITLLPTPLVEISSSEIRAAVRDGRSIRYLVAESVEEYIRSQGLYIS